MLRTRTMIAVVAGAWALSAAAQAQAPKAPDLSSLTWIAGQRQLVRADGTLAYESFVGPVANLVSGAVVSPTGGGMTEHFRIGPNEKGEYGWFSANSNAGLTKWSFLPLKSIEPGRITFADSERSWMIEATPGGGTHNVSIRKGPDGKEQRTDYDWKLVPPAK